MNNATTNQLTASIQDQNYTCHIQDSGHLYVIDEPESKGGSNLGPDPSSALLASLASCTAITLKMYADHKEIKTGKISVFVEMEQEGEAKNIKTTFKRRITTEFELNDDQKKRFDYIASVCPVSRLLKGEIEIQTID